MPDRRIAPEAVLLPESGGRWVALNVFARTCLGLDSAAIDVLGAAESATDQQLLADYAGRTFNVWDIQRFSNRDGLLADPSRFVRDAGSWPAARSLDVAALVKRFTSSHLLIEDDTAYRARCAPKRTLTDGVHFGNFHQQLGQELLLVQREASPSAWWLRQKFTGDLRAVRDNLYRAVQELSLRRYFAAKLARGGAVVDLGCGIGFYANVMAASGAHPVIGVDPNADYIAHAREHAAEGVRFETAPVGEPGALDWIPSASADFVFMSDVLLFYFVPPAPNQHPDLGRLLADVRRILRPGGELISVEPHHLFWLAPWLGDARHPFTIVSEYAHKWFGVTPTFGQLVQAWTKAGFALTGLEELSPDPAFEHTDTRAYHFAREFPLWHLCELKVLS